MRVDFKEIPEATGGAAVADTWELFARDFMVALGFEQESGPDRGADEGRDLIVVGRYSGPLGPSASRWIVSCKHKAHSGDAVSKQEEIDPTRRVHRLHADGFIAFYSTLPGETLRTTFDRSRSAIPIEVFDAACIERELLGNPALEALFKRYFPQSHAAWERAQR